MDASTFDLKKEYQNFVTELKNYHEKTAGFTGPEQMVIQFDTRLKILDNLSELCSIFSDNSCSFISAFDQYKEYQKKMGVNIDYSFFSDLIQVFISLINEKEEINIWVNKLYNESKYLEEAKVYDLSIEDITKI